MTPNADLMPDLEAIAALMAQVKNATAGAPELADLDLDEVLRFIDGKRAIFTGTYKDTPAIARFYFEEPRAYARRDWAELQRVRPFMTDPPYRVNEPLYHMPDLGLLVVRRDDGQPMLEKLWQADPADRAAMMPPAVHWLRAYTRPMERRAPMRAASWLAKAEKRLRKQGSARLRPLLIDLNMILHRLVPVMEGHDWRVTISHGDFHPNNLLVGDGLLTGIDTGGSAKLPIYKDMARFLTHMGRRGMHPTGDVRFGVDAGTFDLFAQAFDLDAPEREVWLPFMIGIEGLLRLETNTLSRGRLRRAESFYETLLADLRKIDV
ncbi:MAG: phosphotransferase [Pseudomonadota bacterium]